MVISPVVVVSKSLLEVKTVAKKFPDTVQLVIASWIGQAANENVFDSAGVEKSSSRAARFLEEVVEWVMRVPRGALAGQLAAKRVCCVT